MPNKSVFNFLTQYCNQDFAQFLISSFKYIIVTKVCRP